LCFFAGTHPGCDRTHSVEFTTPLVSLRPAQS